MPPFKDEQILLIAPGSQTTLAQLGLPESFTPARLRFRSRMFPADKAGEYEPNKVRRKQQKHASLANGAGTQDGAPTAGESDNEAAYEEDPISEDGAVWPIEGGRVTDWPCFFALIEHIYMSINPSFHTPILLLTPPVWTPREHEKITQFFFEKFKTPAFGLMDSAMATAWAYGLHTATVVDMGLAKTDVTAISEFIAHDVGRATAVPDCGGEALTQRLFELLGPQGLTRDMCEQLKRNPICEVLPLGASLPGPEKDGAFNPASAASTGANGSGPDQRTSAGALGDAPRGPRPDTEVGEETNEDEDNEGILDVASIVTSGKMSEYLAKKEREKAERAAAKKKGGDAAAAAARPARLPNSRRERNTFVYEDHALLDALKNMNMNGEKMAEARAALDEGLSKAPSTDGETTQMQTHNGEAPPPEGTIRREIEVGVERFQAASGGVLERIADAVHRTISSVEAVSKRAELWDSLIIVGNGSKVKGFKDALLATLHSKYLISPSSATIFTSELPSNLSTPLATGANTPQPQIGPHGGSGGLQQSSSHVNPLLLAATTAHQASHLHPSSSGLGQSSHSHNLHSSHGQTPTSIKLAKIPEYFPEWKDHGYEEAAFLGAQVAAKVLFVVDQGMEKGYMTRSDYNEQGPSGIHDYSM